MAGLDGEISHACFPEEHKLYIANIVNQELVKDRNLFKTDGSEESRNSLLVKDRYNWEIRNSLEDRVQTQELVQDTVPDTVSLCFTPRHS